MEYFFKDEYDENTDFLVEYNSLIEFRKNDLLDKLKLETELHHIKPKCFFKYDEFDKIDNEDNLIYLYNHEHFMSHYFLFKINENSSNNIKAEKMFDSMKISLCKVDKSMLYYAKLYEQEKINYYKVLSKIEQKDIKLICEYYLQNDKLPSKLSKDKEVKRLSYKIMNLKTKFNNGKLLEESINLFHKLNCGIILEKNKDLEEENELSDIKLICNYYIENNKIPSIKNKDEEIKRLGYKLDDIKKKFKKKKLCYKSIKLIKDSNCEYILYNLGEKEIHNIKKISDFIKYNKRKPKSTKNEVKYYNILKSLRNKYGDMGIKSKKLIKKLGLEEFIT